MEISLDRYDIAILNALQKDGRISNLELADKVGRSASPCSRRVKQLEDSGLIAGYAARRDPKLLGLSLTALVHISMDRHTPERFANFESNIMSFPEVLECYLITGQSADYVLKVMVKDMEAYQAFLLGKLTRIEGVTGVHSSFVMRKVVDHGPLPITP